MDKIRFGIIGTNFVSDWMADAIAASQDCVAAAVFSRAEETGRAFAEKHSIPLVFTDLEQFLSSDAIDAVYIASPNYKHLEQAKAAMNHGLAVLCEKPAGLTARQLEEMEQTARENGVLFMEAMRPAYDPVTERIESLLPQLGPIRRAALRMNQYSSRYDAFLSGDIKNAFTPALGNAAIMDIGIYCIFMAARLFGMPDRVQADSIFLHNGMEGEGTLLLGYPAMQALVEYSKITDSVPGCVIEGEKGWLAFDRITSPSVLRLHLRKQEEQVFPLDPLPNNMIYEVNAFANLYKNGRSAEDYLRVTRIEAAIVDAAREKAGIVLPGEN